MLLHPRLKSPLQNNQSLTYLQNKHLKCTLLTPEQTHGDIYESEAQLHRRTVMTEKCKHQMQMNSSSVRSQPDAGGRGMQHLSVISLRLGLLLPLFPCDLLWLTFIITISLASLLSVISGGCHGTHHIDAADVLLDSGAL